MKMAYLKAIGLVLAAGVIAFLVWLSASFVMSHSWVGLVVLGALAVLACGLFWFALKSIHERIAARNARIDLHRLEVQSRQAEIEEAAERRRLAYEDAAERRRIEAERWRFDAWYKAEQLRLQAEQQSMMHFSSNDVLALRRPGGNVEIAYVPMPRLAGRVVNAQEVGDKVLVSEQDTVEMLPAPRQKRIPTASELLAAGELDGDDILMGFDAEGLPVRRSWRKLMALLLLGMMGGGKTNTASWIIGQEVWRGARIALIDKHARFDESTYRRLKMFSRQFDTPCGDSPQAAMRVVKHVRSVYENRLAEGGSPEYTLLFAIDEFTAIMLSLDDKEDEWYEVARALKTLLGKLNSEGRKLGIHVICVGQATNASRSGGTDVRDLFPTRIVHAMRARQAGLLGLTEEKKDIQRLETGQVYVDIAGRDDPFAMSVPLVDDAYLAAISRALNAKNEAFTDRSEVVQSQEAERSRTDTERSVNGVQHSLERLTDKMEKVLELRNLKLGKAAIIEEVWHAKKGGNQAYKVAESEYEAIVKKLVSEGVLQVN
jgi:hypothetical protein